MKERDKIKVFLQTLGEKEVKRILSRLKGKYYPMARKVLKMRLGLSDKTIPLTLGETGKRLGLKAEEIHQIETKALKWELQSWWTCSYLEEFKHLDYLLGEHLDGIEKREIVDLDELRKQKMLSIRELNIGPFSSIRFAKLKIQGQYICSLGIERIESKWWFFRKTPLKMKIAGEVYNLPMVGMDSNAPSLNTNALRTSGIWKIDKEISEKILEADSITIRVSYIRYSHHPPTTWEVPSNVLDKWKQVIREKF